MIQLLNGLWNYRIGKGKWEEIVVPFSKLAVGHSECKLNFDLKEKSDKIFLKFDGVTYYGEVTLNGKYLGEMGPYSEYTFDITDIAQDKNNQLLVELEDINRAFGPSEGWENFGGIIRDVSVIYKNESYIDDVFFHTTLKNDYKDSDFVVETKTINPENCEYEISLSFGGKEVLKYIQKTDETLTKEIKNVNLWCLESPNLYQLKVNLVKNGEIVDTYECNVGFREIYCNRHRFVFNGKELYLQGVCKHEMIGDSGHCPTLSEMEDDMRKIKETGCNFVRLVHYPHHKNMIDIADKLGLMISEEPGLWWSDTANPDVAQGSIEVLKRTIMRDRNHPSIMFWLCFNECVFTEQFLIDSAKACREYDPTRMVSGANCMSVPDTLKYYNICGFDFYTMHPYSHTLDRVIESTTVLHDKPILFTEWGGYYIYNNHELLLTFMDYMYKLYEQNSDEGALAGAFFWFWAELNDFNRGRPACIDGNLHEGLVDKNRNKTAIYDTFVRGLKLAEKPLDRNKYWFNATKDYENLSSLYAFKAPGNKEHFYDVFTKVADEARNNSDRRRRNLTIGPVLKEVPFLSKVPTLIDDKDSVTFEGSAKTNKLSVFGLTSIKKGYPLKGEYGEDVADLIITFDDGTEKIHTLKNGVDVTTAFALRSSSRIDPRCENAPRIARFGYDKNFEDYVLNKLDINLDKTSEIKNITVKSKNNGYALLIYGILA